MWPYDLDRKHHEPAQMSSDDLVAAYAAAVRFRACEVSGDVDTYVRLWMFTASQELRSRGQLDLIREHLPVYHDPTRKQPVYGPGTECGSPAPAETVLAPVRPPRAIGA